MSKLKALVSVVSGLLSFSATSARGDLLFDCNVIARQINQSTPQKLDQVTTLLNATCAREGRNVRMLYRNRVDAQPGTVNQATLNLIRPQMVNTWCTDPEQRSALNLINIQYRYIDSSGNHIGKIDISKSDCR